MIIYTKTTHKKKRKVSAKQKANKQMTDYINSKWAVDETKLNKPPLVKQYKLEIPADRVGPKIESHGPTIGNTDKVPSPIYTGDAVVGIATMNKSNLVPVFSKQEAEDVAKMRR